MNLEAGFSDAEKIILGRPHVFSACADTRDES
jgi:hypothetical protein